MFNRTSLRPASRNLQPSASSTSYTSMLSHKRHNHLHAVQLCNWAAVQQYSGPGDPGPAMLTLTNARFQAPDAFIL